MLPQRDVVFTLLQLFLHYAMKSWQNGLQQDFVNVQYLLGPNSVDNGLGGETAPGL